MINTTTISAGSPHYQYALTSRKAIQHTDLVGKRPFKAIMPLYGAVALLSYGCCAWGTAIYGHQGRVHFCLVVLYKRRVIESITSAK